MDLAGPKLRTGALERGPEVLRYKPRRDPFGRVIAPARVWLTPAEHPVPPPTPASATLPLPASWLARLRVGDEISLLDTRESQRTLHVAERRDASCWAESNKTAYVATGTRLRHDGEEASVAQLPARAVPIVLRTGDMLLVTRDATPGRPAHDGQPASVPCTLPEVFADVRVGQRIYFDDGKLAGQIRAVDAEHLAVQITRAHPEGFKLGADKGINLPDSELRLPALGAKDREDLAFVARHADLVGLSFVHRADDVRELQRRLGELGGERLGVVLKIETQRGFEQLPSLLLAAMSWRANGVMIARGDLAVECGYERLAEVQEEILWICEAAHVPVIWATQVLEHLAKDGLPSRAEITDAAMGERAECVMLNKGPHILEALAVLEDILVRMEAHQHKKRAMLRPLHLADHFSPTKAEG
jgi:pyruvate kinase